MATENPVLALREALAYQADRICVTFRHHTPPTCETHWSEWPVGADCCEWRQAATALIAAVRAETLAGSGVAMDFPAAWEFIRGTKIKDHDPRCSWVGAGMLCDCGVLGAEYERRKSKPATPPTPALTAARESDMPSGKCPVCWSDVTFRLPPDWQDRVERGQSIPIVGCGNSWHYAVTEWSGTAALAAEPPHKEETHD